MQSAKLTKVGFLPSAEILLFGARTSINGGIPLAVILERSEGSRGGCSMSFSRASASVIGFVTVGRGGKCLLRKRDIHPSGE